jgi:Immunity protein 21
MLNWYETQGGPFLLMGDANLSSWRGSSVSMENNVFESDYERVCHVKEYVGLISVGGEDALVLADEPMPTAILQTEDVFYIIRWIWCQSHLMADHHFEKIPKDTVAISENLNWMIKSKNLILLDAADSFQGSNNLCKLKIKINPGTYMVTTGSYEPTSKAKFLIHTVKRAD